MAELDAKQFSVAVTTYVTSYFLTARLAARFMIPNRSGVNLTMGSLDD